MQPMRTVFFATLLTLFFVTAPASAQEIIQLGDPPSQDKAPAKKQNAPTADRPPNAGEAGEAGDEVESQISVFNAKGALKTNSNASARMPAEDLYQGIIPGKREEVDHLASGGDSNTLMWVGFKPGEKSTGVFFQTSSAARYTVGTDGMGNVTVTFSDTGIGSSNFQRFIDTSFFDRSIRRIETEVVGGDVVVRIARDGSEEPNVSRDGNFLHLVFADVN